MKGKSVCRSAMVMGVFISSMLSFSIMLMGILLVDFTRGYKVNNSLGIAIYEIKSSCNKYGTTLQNKNQLFFYTGDNKYISCVNKEDKNDIFQIVRWVSDGSVNYYCSLGSNGVLKIRNKRELTPIVRDTAEYRIDEDADYYREVKLSKEQFEEMVECAKNVEKYAAPVYRDYRISVNDGSTLEFYYGDKYYNRDKNCTATDGFGYYWYRKATDTDKKLAEKYYEREEKGTESLSAMLSCVDDIVLDRSDWFR